MKSVCIIVQNVYDMDTRVRRKAEALASAGYSVDVLALAGPNAKKSYTLNNVNIQTVSLGKKRGSLARYVYEYAAFFAWAFFRLLWLTRQKGYVVIDVNTLPDFLIFAAAPGRWFGAKLVLDMHEITPEFYMSKYGVSPDSRLIRLLNYLEKVSFNFADHVVTITEPIQELLISRGLDPAKTIVVMNSADETHFSSSKPSPVADGASDGFRMIYHGTLTRLYGLDIAIEAFHLAHKEMPGAELWILGSGTEKEALEELARRLGLESRVKLVGQVPSSEISSWLKRADAGILPIRRDVFLDFAFPNKLPEFIIMERPVLVSRLKTIRRYFSEEALSYFEPHNSADLARQMVRLYRDSGLRARLAARAKQEYIPIRWEVMKQRYLKLIEDVAGSAGPVIACSDVAEVSVAEPKELFDLGASESSHLLT